MQIVIDIDYESLFSETQMLSSFEGKHEYDEKGDSMYDVIKILQQDRPLLERYMKEAVKSIVGVLREFVTGVSESAITCDMPNSFNDAFSGDIQERVKTYIVNSSFFLYMKTRNADRAKDYLELSSQDLKDIRDKVYYRKKPTKKLWN